jgi:hypothetical protein
MTIDDRDENIIAGFRAWLADKMNNADDVTGVLSPLNRIAAGFPLPAVFILAEINAEKACRRRSDRFEVNKTPQKPDLASPGEEAFAAYLDAGEVGGTDTVCEFARQFRLSSVYARLVLDTRGVAVPMMRRRRTA